MASGVSEANEVRAPTTGGAPAGIQSLMRSFSMYITYVYCAIIEPRLWNIVPSTKKKRKKKSAGRKSRVVGGSARRRPP